MPAISIRHLAGAVVAPDAEHGLYPVPPDPEEALAGVTLHAARALGLEARHGSLEVGKLADFVAWDIERPAELAYWLGGDLPKRVIRHAEEVYRG